MSYDLTFVAPDRRDEVRRRIAAVERFIAAPGRAAAEAAASDLGLRAAQFYNLVRAWRESGLPEAIAGRSAPRNRSPGIDRRLLDLIDKVVVGNGRAPASDIIGHVAREARASRIPLPDPGTLALNVRRKRPLLLTEEVRSMYDLVVDHTVLDLPVDFGGGVRRPLATLAIDVAADAVVGLAISPATPSSAATAAAILDALRRGTRHGHFTPTKPRIGIVARSPEEASNVIALLRRYSLHATCRLTGAHGGGLIAETVLGIKHAGIRLRQRLVWYENSRRWIVLAPGAMPLTPKEAVALARGRLLDSRATTVFAGLGDIRLSRFLSELNSLAQTN